MTNNGIRAGVSDYSREAGTVPGKLDNTAIFQANGLGAGLLTLKLEKAVGHK
jgi:hypothetical protein